MNTIKLEAEINGVLYSAEARMPDLKGHTGQMSTYSGLHGTVSRLCWKLAYDIENKVDSRKSSHWAEYIGGQ